MRDKEKRKASNRKYAKSEKRKAYEKEYMTKFRSLPEQKIKARESAYKRRYGITISDYDRMFLEQQGKCFICTKPPKSGKHLFVDHNHKSGRVRGLLCSHCNRYIIGRNGDKTNAIEIFENVVKYLKKAKEGEKDE